MIRRASKFLAWLAFAGISWIIIENTIPYLLARDGIPFLEERPWLATAPVYRAVLGMHCGAAIVCLASSLLQFWRPLIRRLPSLHRRLGRAYVGSVLVVLFPTGFFLAFSAKGGWAGILGFHLLGALTFWTTWRGWIAMRRGVMREHIVWMIRSFAMIANALTARLLMMGCYLLGVDDATGYVASLYLSIAGNAGLAELLISRTKLQSRISSRPNPKTRTTMKTRTRILTTLSLLSVGALLIAGETEKRPAAKTAPRVGDGIMRPNIKESIVPMIHERVIQPITPVASFRARLSRARIAPSMWYEHQFTDAKRGAPGQTHFAIVERHQTIGIQRKAPSKEKEAAPKHPRDGIVALRGYYDLASNSIWLFDGESGKHVKADRHPLVKQRMAERTKAFGKQFNVFPLPLKKST